MKTAGRILGRAFFSEGFVVQDAPRYGAERRGAPIFSYVRASLAPINERGAIRIPDLVVVADKTLLHIPSAGVFDGCTGETVLLVRTGETAESLKEGAGFTGRLLYAPDFEMGAGGGQGSWSSAWAGAAARLCGKISPEILARAVSSELHGQREAVIRAGVERAGAGFEAMAEHAGIVSEKERLHHTRFPSPQWVELSWEPLPLSVPAIRSPRSSQHLKTGLWRTARPEMDREKCRKCWWNCSVLCPDSAVSVDEEGYPRIDYDFCKGCLVCASVCPRKAITVKSEAACLGEEDKAP